MEIKKLNEGSEYIFLISDLDDSVCLEVARKGDYPVDTIHVGLYAELRLYFRKEGKNKIRIHGTYADKTLGEPLITPPENVFSKIQKKRNGWEAMAAFEGMPGNDVSLFSAAVGESVALTMAQDPISESQQSHISEGMAHNISEDERKNAEELLKNPERWNLIKTEIDRTYIGQDHAKMTLFIKWLQAYTELYPQIEIEGESSVGKTSMTETLYKFFPDEDKDWMTEFSPTALRKMPELLNKKIIVVSQEEGMKNKYHIMMASRDDQTGDCRIVNTETNEVDVVKLPKACFTSMSTNFFIDNSQSDTRTDRIFLDESVEQNKKAGDFIADNLAEDTEIKEYLGKIESTKANEIKNTIRLYKEGIIKVNIPYAPYLKESMDFSKQSAKRHLKSMAGALEAITNFNRYDRDIYIIGNNIRLISTYEDLEIYNKYCEEHLTQTYYDVPNKYKEFIELMKNLSEKSWVTKGWVYIKTLEDEGEKLGLSRATTQRYVKHLAENYPYIERGTAYEYDEKGNKLKDEDGRVIKKLGYSYKFTLDVPDSIFSTIDINKINNIIEEYKTEKIKQGAEIKKYSAYYVRCEIPEIVRSQ